MEPSCFPCPESIEPEVKTNDVQMVTLPVQVLYQVANAANAYYVVESPRKAIRALISNHVKAQAASMSLQDIYDDRDSIMREVKDLLSTEINSWGYEVTNVLIDNPDLTDEMQAAYNRVAMAQREQQAATAEGEALRIRSVAQATAYGESLKIMCVA